MARYVGALVIQCTPLRPCRLNVNGGAIAIGHPLGMSGARILTHLTHELRRRKGKLAIGSACIGGGQVRVNVRC